MTEKKTQRTPGGIEIPIPTKGEVFGALIKIARPKLNPKKVREQKNQATTKAPRLS